MKTSEIHFLLRKRLVFPHELVKINTFPNTLTVKTARNCSRSVNLNTKQLCHGRHLDAMYSKNAF